MSSDVDREEKLVQMRFFFSAKDEVGYPNAYLPFGYLVLPRSSKALNSVP